jgi:hypothetical protein
MTLTSTVNYKDSYFEHSVLTKVGGEPSYETLQALTKEPKANASSIPSLLGGGNNVYLGLIISPVAYDIVALGHPYVPPPNPGPLTVRQPATQYEILLAEDQHKTAKKQFLEALLLECTLIQQIVDAIEPNYLCALRNPTTGAITPPSP